MLVIVVGLTGVGKSTVINHARQLDTCPQFTVVNYGDVLLELAQERGLADNRDELTDIPPEPYSELQKAVPRHIADLAEDELIILDTHATLKTPTGYRPGLPKDTIDVLNPANISFIKAPGQAIANRRAGDDTRDRDNDTPPELQQQQQVALRMASTNAVLAGCPLKYIPNKKGKIDYAAAELADMLAAQ